MPKLPALLYHTSAQLPTVHTDGHAQLLAAEETVLHIADLTEHFLACLNHSLLILCMLPCTAHSSGLQMCSFCEDCMASGTGMAFFHTIPEGCPWGKSPERCRRHDLRKTRHAMYKAVALQICARSSLNFVEMGCTSCIHSFIHHGEQGYSTVLAN